MAAILRYSAGSLQSRAAIDYQAVGFTSMARLHCMYDTYTFVAVEGSGSGGVQVEFPPLLDGQVLVIPRMCSVYIDDAGANTVFAIGHRAYRTSVKEDPTTGIVNSLGVQVAENLAAFATGVADSAGPIANVWSGLTTAVLVEPTAFDAQDGLRIVVTITAGDMDINDVLKVLCVYAHLQ